MSMLAQHRDDAAGPNEGWRLCHLSGRLIELCGQANNAALSMAAGLVLEAQLAAEPAAWVTTTQSSFFPPDLGDLGVDLAALAVVRVPDFATVARAADPLLRSGAFGLVVLDLGECSELPIPLQSRLLGLAQKHHAAVVCLSQQDSHPHGSTALGSLASLRLRCQHRHSRDGVYQCDMEALKDKRRAPGWTYQEERHGAVGLR